MAHLLLDDISFTAPAPLPVTGLGAKVFGKAGITQYWYWVAAYYPVGTSIAGPFHVPNAPDTLGGNNFVHITWDPAITAPPAGMVDYDVVRTDSPMLPMDPEEPLFFLGHASTDDTFFDDEGIGDFLTNTVFTSFGSPVTRRINLNNRDFQQPTLRIPSWVEVNRLIFPDGTFQETAGGGGGNPGGDLWDVQFNNGNAFAGTERFRFNQDAGNIFSVNSRLDFSIGYEIPIGSIMEPGFIYVSGDNGDPIGQFTGLPSLSISEGARFEYTIGDTFTPLWRLIFNANGPDQNFTIERISDDEIFPGGFVPVVALFIERQDGFVGINTGSPNYRLDVNGDINTRGVLRVNGVPISTGTGQNQTPWLSNIDGGGFALTNTSAITISNAAANSQLNLTSFQGRTYGLRMNTGGTFQIVDVTTSNTIRMAIGTSGNVGIGNVGAAAFQLEVEGDINTSGQYRLGPTSNSFVLNGGLQRAATTNNIQLWANNTGQNVQLGYGSSTFTPTLTVAGSRVGIGIANPTSTLHVQDGDVNITGAVTAPGTPGQFKINGVPVTISSRNFPSPTFQVTYDIFNPIVYQNTTNKPIFLQGICGFSEDGGILWLVIDEVNPPNQLASVFVVPPGMVPAFDPGPNQPFGAVMTLPISAWVLPQQYFMIYAPRIVEGVASTVTAGFWAEYT